MIDCEKIPKEVMRLINNYPLHVVEVMDYPDTGKFRTDMKEVFRFIQCSEDKQALRDLTESAGGRFQEMDEDAFDVITALTGSEELDKVKDSCMEEGGKIDMCRAIKEMLADERLEGVVEGTQKGARSKAEIVAKNMFLRGMSEEDTAAICEEDVEQIRKWFLAWRKK